MSKVSILCGESPLPVCQALKTLNPSEAVIIHGSGSSRDVALRVKNFATNTLNFDDSKIHLLEVDPWNPIECNRQAFAIKDLLSSSTFVYGPGTSVMNTVVHDVWRWAGGNDFESGQSWYLKATPSQLLATNALAGDSSLAKNIVPTGLDAFELIKLHNSDQEDVSISHPPADISIPKSVATQVHNSLYNSLHIDELPLETKEYVKQYDGVPGVGTFLESVLYSVFKQSLINIEVLHSVKKITIPHKKEILEMDLLLRQDDQCIWVSCATAKKNTQNLSTFRKKFFEAKENAHRLTGKESRSITVVTRLTPDDDFKNRTAYGKTLRKRLDIRDKPTVADRHIIVDLAEILGEDPNMTALNPAAHIQKSWVYNWIIDSFRTF
jgi:hypothetical protein